MFFISFAFGAISDCYEVVSLAMGLNLQLVNQTRMSILNQDCCLDVGVTCVNGKVVKIGWNDMNLNGTLNMSAIPNALGDFRAQRNKIRGQIDQIPLSMTTIDMSSNLLNGTLPLPSPYQLQYNLDFNGFEGTIPIFKISLVSLFVNSNKLSGQFKIFEDPTLTVGLCFLDNNQFSGPLSVSFSRNSVRANNNLFTQLLDTSLPNIQALQLQFNLFTGLFPFHTPKLNVIRLQNNQFSGQLTLNQPSHLNISGNLFTEITITNTSLLTFSNCFLNGNPLLNSPTIQNLTMCNQTGIYAIEITTLPLHYSSTSTSTYSTRLPIVLLRTRNIQVTTQSTMLSSTYLLSRTKSFQLTTKYTTTTQSTTLAIVDGQSTPLLKQVLTIFNILKLVVDVAVLLYVIVKLVKRSVRKHNFSNSNASYKHAVQTT